MVIVGHNLYKVNGYFSLFAHIVLPWHGIEFDGGSKKNKKNIFYLKEILALKRKAMGQFVKISSAKIG
jgi:hypothetical protein